MASSSSFLPQLAGTLVSNLPSLPSDLESVLPLALGRSCCPGVWASAVYAGDFTGGFVLSCCHYKLSLATSFVQLLFHPIGRPWSCCFAWHKALWLPYCNPFPQLIPRLFVMGPLQHPWKATQHSAASAAVGPGLWNKDFLAIFRALRAWIAWKLYSMFWSGWKDKRQ